MNDKSDTELYRIEAEVRGSFSAYELRELIEERDDCTLTAFDENKES